MYTLTDVVEMGHSEFIGGTVKISISFTSILSKEKKKEVLNTIDYLDHCMITNKESYLKWSKRFFYIDKTTTLLEDVVGILSILIPDFKQIEVSIGKDSYVSENNKNILNILKYEIEG